MYPPLKSFASRRIHLAKMRESAANEISRRIVYRRCLFARWNHARKWLSNGESWRAGGGRGTNPINRRRAVSGIKNNGNFDNQYNSALANKIPLFSGAGRKTGLRQIRTSPAVKRA